MNMELLISKMTGSELKKLYKRSSYKTVEQFADKLGIGRTSMQKAFNMNEVPEEIEGAIDRDRELQSLRNELFKISQSSPGSDSTPGTKQNMDMVVMQNVMEMTQMMATAITTAITSAVRDSMKEMMVPLRETLEKREQDYDLIRKQSNTFQAIVEDGVRRGAIVFQAPK